MPIAPRRGRSVSRSTSVSIRALAGMLPVRRRQPGGRTDPYQEITGRIITALERGTVPWRTPWRARGHRNARSNRPYRGINTLVLQMTALERGWSDPRWLTYRQAEAAGGHVRRGEHGHARRALEVDRAEGSGGSRAGGAFPAHPPLRRLQRRPVRGR